MLIHRIQTKKGSNRVLRGGSWNNTAANCRIANRNNNTPDNRNDNNGFRVALSQHKRRAGSPLLNRFVFPSTLWQIENNRIEVVTKTREPPVHFST